MYFDKYSNINYTDRNKHVLKFKGRAFEELEDCVVLYHLNNCPTKQNGRTIPYFYQFLTKLLIKV